MHVTVKILANGSRSGIAVLAIVIKVVGKAAPLKQPRRESVVVQHLVRVRHLATRHAVCRMPYAVYM